MKNKIKAKLLNGCLYDTDPVRPRVLPKRHGAPEVKAYCSKWRACLVNTLLKRRGALGRLPPLSNLGSVGIKHGAKKGKRPRIRSRVDDGKPGCDNIDQVM